ncbi:MAG: 1,6-anhydro-N-acetylmuramyl-L-alanine amidase AmpD [Chromatiales bacterium]|nr:1,6-anhydro-N-acetylmuramyl-L-alanine amidase AmpD [Chromatiales bacterium]
MQVRIPIEFSVANPQRVRNARFIASPNHNERPAGTAIDLLVIHSISLPPGRFGGPWIADLFLNRLDPAADPYFAEVHALRVSAHFLVRRRGGLVQFVPVDRRAWHAGRSSFAGRAECNDYSIGVELEGDDRHGFTASQYRRLASLTAALQKRFPGIGPERIVGHEHIAPGRKTDPGPAFDWPQFRALVRAAGGRA